MSNFKQQTTNPKKKGKGNHNNQENSINKESECREGERIDKEKEHSDRTFLFTCAIMGGKLCKIVTTQNITYMGAFKTFNPKENRFYIKYPTLHQYSTMGKHPEKITIIGEEEMSFGVEEIVEISVDQLETPKYFGLNKALKNPQKVEGEEGMGGIRTLEKFQFEEGELNIQQLIKPETNNQFEILQERYNYKSTYEESLGKYTTLVDHDSLTEAQRKNAMRITRELEGGPKTGNIHMDEERFQEGIREEAPNRDEYSEESKYSAVLKKGEMKGKKGEIVRRNWSPPIVNNANNGRNPILDMPRDIPRPPGLPLPPGLSGEKTLDFSKEKPKFGNSRVDMKKNIQSDLLQEVVPGMEDPNMNILYTGNKEEEVIKTAKSVAEIEEAVFKGNNTDNMNRDFNISLSTVDSRVLKSDNKSGGKKGNRPPDVKTTATWGQINVQSIDVDDTWNINNQLEAKGDDTSNLSSPLSPDKQERIRSRTNSIEYIDVATPVISKDKRAEIIKHKKDKEYNRERSMKETKEFSKELNERMSVDAYNIYIYILAISRRDTEPKAEREQTNSDPPPTWREYITNIQTRENRIRSNCRSTQPLREREDSRTKEGSPKISKREKVTQQEQSERDSREEYYTRRRSTNYELHGRYNQNQQTRTPQNG